MLQEITGLPTNAFGVDLMSPGSTVILRNAKIDMFKGSMRLAVDKWSRIEVTEPATFVVKEDNNLSLVEYELVNANFFPAVTKIGGTLGPRSRSVEVISDCLKAEMFELMALDPSRVAGLDEGTSGSREGEDDLEVDNSSEEDTKEEDPEEDAIGGDETK
ncbi:hypothetical protein BUALT_Bualt03G0188400 [Buddleja alternifolia]|uniref:Single-stranded DNA binding protein Ssb-like OB fold domain-containing protein n=1 Tax=Buddleja alternifolia TaxID=168488 RepID=A0AAV6XX50_9LAMI|nr:hypothetical protein BUALT_Bualt03G0188400 [Buddleja alternifolia]